MGANHRKCDSLLGSLSVFNENSQLACLLQLISTRSDGSPNDNVPVQSEFGLRPSGGGAYPASMCRYRPPSQPVSAEISQAVKYLDAISDTMLREVDGECLVYSGPKGILIIRSCCNERSS